MKLAFCFLLVGLSEAADRTIFHDEAPTEGHVKHFADGAPLARGYDNHLHAAPTRAPQAYDHDWDKHDGVKRGGNEQYVPGTAHPSKFPTPLPTHTPTTSPTFAPTAAPTRDSKRIIKTCSELGQTSVVWYSSTTLGNDGKLQICKGDINEGTCPAAKRCLLEKEEGGQTYTSTCSHVHCTVSTDASGRQITKVKHHHAEKYGSMHICQQGLHKDYGHVDHCGCECFDELAGDNDWLTGLAHRNLQDIANDPNYMPVVKKSLRTHKKVAGRAYLGELLKEGGGGTHLWDGSTPTSHENKHQFPGYENHKKVTMFGYNN